MSIQSCFQHSLILARAAGFGPPLVAASEGGGSSAAGAMPPSAAAANARAKSRRNTAPSKPSRRATSGELPERPSLLDAHRDSLEDHHPPQRRATGMGLGSPTGMKFAPKERKQWKCFFSCFEKKSEYEKRRDARKKAWKAGEGKGAPRRLSKHISWNEERLIEPPSPASLKADEPPPAVAVREPRPTHDALARGVHAVEAIPGVKQVEGVVGKVKDEAVSHAPGAIRDIDDEAYACPSMLGMTGPEAQFQLDHKDAKSIGLLDIVCCGKNDCPAKRPTLGEALAH